jgi:hypothetical protein
MPDADILDWYAHRSQLLVYINCSLMVYMFACKI